MEMNFNDICLTKSGMCFSIYMCFIVVMCLPELSSSSSPWTPQQYPNPQRDVEACGRNGKKSWICDPDKVISSTAADALDYMIEDFKNSTGNCICGDECPIWGYYRGYQPAIALIEKMDLSPSASSSQKKKAGFDFADYLRDDSWEYGECNDDFVIFFSALDRQIYTSTGDETILILTDACVQSVYSNVKSLFSDGNIESGLKKMMQEYKQVFEHKHVCQKSAGATTYIIIGVIVGLLILGCIGFVCLKDKFCPDSCKSSGTSSSSHYKSGGSSSARRYSAASSASSGGGGGDF